MAETNNICELVACPDGVTRIRVAGHLLSEVSNRCGSTLWLCYGRPMACSGSAVTSLVEGKHILIDQLEHNHPPVSDSVLFPVNLKNSRIEQDDSGNSSIQEIGNSKQQLPVLQQSPRSRQSVGNTQTVCYNPHHI